MNLTKSHIALGLIYATLGAASLGTLAALAVRAWRAAVARIDAAIAEAFGDDSTIVATSGSAPVAGSVVAALVWPCVRMVCDVDTGSEAVLWCSEKCQDIDREATARRAMATHWAPEQTRPRLVAVDLAPADAAWAAAEATAAWQSTMARRMQ